MFDLVLRERERGREREREREKELKKKHLSHCLRKEIQFLLSPKFV